MAFVPSALLSIRENTPLDEQRWVNIVQDTLDVTEEEESHATQIPVCVCCPEGSGCKSLPPLACTTIRDGAVLRPIKFTTKIPWSIVASLPIASTIKSSAEKIIYGDNNQMEQHEDENNQQKSPLAVEFTIPSVSDLSRAGIQFSPVEGDLTRINFDLKNFTLYLPVIGLDSYSDVILRNLVAYEASIVWGPLTFARYIEFMNGIIDTEEDVRILCKRGVIENRMKSDREAADLWNGMNRSLRLTKVPFFDKVIDDVNKFYGNIWSVKCRRLMKKYVFSSWQILIFLATILLLALSCIQAFCSVYKCNPLLSSLQDE